jgi:hypothetical protein
MHTHETAKELPLSVVLEDLETYASTFKLTDTLSAICEEALRKTWKEKSQLSEWEITDRYGKKLSLHGKLGDVGISPQDMIFMSKKVT